MSTFHARRSALFAVLSLLLAGVATLPAAAAEDAASSAPADFPCLDASRERPGLGLSCRVDFGFKVFLRDGSAIYTHGGDAVPPPVEVASHASKAPFCVASTTEYHNIAIYTRPSDKVNRYAEMVPKIRTMIHQANGHLYGEAQETGGTADYRFACTSGTVAVLSAALATPSGTDTWSSIVSDLKSLGFNDAKAKYWIWHDDLIDCGCGGIANLYSDSRRIVDNHNNGAAGAMYAATFFESWTTMMHESGHNMGAVQLDAPGSNTYFHCNDGQDIMCYAEGGQPYDSTVCGTAHFDCRHDSYFNLNPPAGSYLDTKWNIGWAANRYLQFGNEKPVMTFLSCSPNPVDPGLTSTCTFRATDQSLGVAYTVNWGDGSPLQRVPASGFATPGTDVSAPHTWPSTPGNHTVSVTATDDATPALTSDPLTTSQVLQNAAPVVTALGCAANPAEDRANVVCTFTATDGSAGVHYTVNWGDGSPATRVPATGHVTPGLSQQTTHSWATPGAFEVSVIATDNGPSTLSSAPRALTQTVANVAPTLAPVTCAPSPSADDEVVACALLASDATHAVAYEVTWGDGSPTTRVPASGYLTAGVQTLATHAWSNDGSFAVSAVATDDSATPLTSTVGTFLHQVVVKPKFTDPTCVGGGGTLDTFEGSPFSLSLSASSKVATRTITLALAAGPAGVSVTGAPGNPTSATLDWASPTAGAHAIRVSATDNTGAARECALLLHVAPLGGESFVQGFWVGNAVPVGVDDDSMGTRVTSPGTATNRQSNVVQGTTLVVATVEETAGLTIQAGRVTSHGATQVTQARLLNGALVVEGLTQDATLEFVASTGAASVASAPRIGRILLNGSPLPLPADPAPTEILLPGGSRLVLYERHLETTPADSIYRENLIHVYASEAYGRSESILGSLVLRAGAETTTRVVQGRLIDPEDDARSGRDADANASGAVAIAPGAHDGRFVGTDTRDVYALALKHGENVKLSVQGASQTKVRGGSLTLLGSTTTPMLPSTGWNLPESFQLRLVDPTGAVREWGSPLVTGGASRVELNADLDGTWLVDIERAPPAGRPDVNYTLLAAVAPVLLLPQRDGLSGGDAPASCSPNSPIISSGAWPGVLRDDDRVDVYAFAAELGQLIAVSLKPGEDHDGFEAALVLYDRDCGVLARSTAAPVGLKGATKTVAELPARYSGTYYVAVERVNGVGNTYLSLAVFDPQPSAPVHDAGSSQDAPADRGSAMEAPPGAFQGRLPDGDPGDAYNLRFRPGPGATLTFTGSAQSTFTTTLRTPFGAVVTPTASTGSDRVWVIGNAAPGAYTLEVSPVVGGGGYTIAYGPPAT